MIYQYFIDAERNRAAIEGEASEKLSRPFSFHRQIFPDLVWCWVDSANSS
jgi:hypothetical protein